MNVETLIALDNTLDELTDQVKDEQIERDRVWWQEHGDTDTFDWETPKLHEIDRPEARLLERLWDAFYGLVDLTPDYPKIEALPFSLTDISVPYRVDSTQYIKDSIFPVVPLEGVI